MNSITIAIPAYNESENIKNILESLLKQNYDGFKLEKIVVVNDGSTDKTAEIVKNLARTNPVIKLVDNQKRKGKVTRLNEIYRFNASEFLLVLDGDILLGDKNMIKNLCRALVDNPAAALAAAHQIPIKVKTFAGRAIYGAYKIWDDARLMVPKGDNIQNFYGAASAYRKKFAESLKIPSSITDERGYIYINAKEAGDFIYSRTAFIYYLPVNTFPDFWKLADRSFDKNRVILAKIFGDRVYGMYEIPAIYKTKSITGNLIKDPFYTILGIALNMITRIIPTHDKLYDKGAWEPSTSTKKPAISK